MTHPPFFSSETICSLITVQELIDPLAGAMMAVSQGRATHPPRFASPINAAGRMGVMYGGLDEPAIHGAKFLSLYPDAPAMGLSSHQGFLLLFDSQDGRPLASFDADAITAMRTSAVSMLATQSLARPDPRIITICGAGEQAEWHARASLACFPNVRLRLWARRVEAANKLRDEFGEQKGQIVVMNDLQEALSGADVIHTTTASRTAFLAGEMLEPGQHINLVGASLAQSREIDNRGVARVTMFTDALESSGRESGEIIEAKRDAAIPDDYPVVEIGAVLSKARYGRRTVDQITAYKSHGLIVQDLIAAFEVYRRG